MNAGAVPWKYPPREISNEVRSIPAPCYLSFGFSVDRVDGLDARRQWVEASRMWEPSRDSLRLPIEKIITRAKRNR